MPSARYRKTEPFISYLVFELVGGLIFSVGKEAIIDVHAKAVLEVSCKTQDDVSRATSNLNQATPEGNMIGQNTVTVPRKW